MAPTRMTHLREGSRLDRPCDPAPHNYNRLSRRYPGSVPGHPCPRQSNRRNSNGAAKLLKPGECGDLRRADVIILAAVRSDIDKRVDTRPVRTSG